MIYDQTTDTETSEAPSAGQGAVSSSSAPAPASPAAPDLIAASAPVANQAVSFSLPAGIAPEQGLQVHTIWVARAISVMFPEITTIGGARQDALRWHPNGLAIDVMIPNPGTAEGMALGNEIVAFVRKNAARFGMQDAIWRGTYYTPNGTQAGGYGHYDHVQITTTGGGYPEGRAVYYR